MSTNLTKCFKSTIMLVFLLLTCISIVHAHLQDSCPSLVSGRDIYTRKGTNFGDSMYFWTATYNHGGVQGTGLQSTGGGCYSKSYRKLYFRTSASAFPSCDRGDGSGKSVQWANGQQTTWASGLTSKNSDRPAARPHCNININFQKFWHLLGQGFKLPGPTNVNSDKPLYVSMCFSGFMCEAIQTRWTYKVYKGCDKGFYEDTTITWPKNTAGGIANPEYCIACPPGQYQDQRDQTKGSPNVCKICPTGKFGDEGNYPKRHIANYCASCPAGRYGSAIGSINPLCSGACTPGYFCPPSR